MIRVLVVEDSPVIREFLVYILGSDPAIQVVDAVNNGEDAIEAVRLKKPDVITMDIHMPKMDGFEATRIIMETQPTPIVIVSGSSTAKEVAVTFRAMEGGALAIVPRPKGIGQPDYEATVKELIQTVKLMSEVKVVRRWSNLKKRDIPIPDKFAAMEVSRDVKIVAIGASTGGPIALQTILSELPKDFPVPVVIVQHIASGFAEGFSEWLGQSSRFPVHVAADGEYLLPGHVYVAPDGFHLTVKADSRIVLNREEAADGLRPSVSYLFDSVAKAFGNNALGVLLTGMGKDGAKELKAMKHQGSITIAQDEKSSIVHSMPGEAIRLDAATHVLPLEKIAPALISLVKKKDKEKNYERR
jgi:two-component system chemotaxis response regulator CheB